MWPVTCEIKPRAYLTKTLNTALFIIIVIQSVRSEDDDEFVVLQKPIGEIRWVTENTNREVTVLGFGYIKRFIGGSNQHPDPKQILADLKELFVTFPKRRVANRGLFVMASYHFITSVERRVKRDVTIIGMNVCQDINLQSPNLNKCLRREPRRACQGGRQNLNFIGNMCPIRGGVDPLPLKKSAFFRQYVKIIQHDLKNLFSVFSPLV